jgi:Tfp pilus assembly protein PilN
MAKKINIPAEQLLYTKETGLDENAQQAALESNLSFASLLGLSAVKVPTYANLLPGNLKQEAKTRAKGKERLRIAISILGIFALVVTATLINIKHKTAQLDYLKGQLSKISKEAKTLEAIEERFQLLAKYSSDRVSSLDILRELHRTIPPQVSLLNFSYDDGQELVIRGRAPDLNLVFGFVSSLQSSTVLKKYTSKVRYATQKRTQAGEVVDFEISCVKER